MSSGSTDRRGFLFSPWVQGSLLLALIALGASLQVYSTHRLRAHEVILRRKHEAALSNLQQAAGHCDAAGGVQNLNAVADFIRSEIDHHFNLHDPDGDSQASWFSRAAAGLLMLGVVLVVYGFAFHMDKLPGGVQLWLQQWLSKEHERPATTSKLIAYHLELWFSDNSFSKVLSLLYLTLALVWIGGLGIFAVTGESLYDAFWQAIHGVGIDWTFAGEAVEYGGFLVRGTAVLVSLGGMLVTALMLGLVSEAIGDKIEDLKKGRTEVLESGHTLILGWSDKMLNMIDQLCLANESAGGKAIVILAERDKQDMEEDIHKQIHNLRGSRVLCRSGNPLLAMDLSRVSVDVARAIVVLATAESPERSDARVLRIVLSLMGVHDRLKKSGIEGGLKGHIVAEVCDLDNEPLVKMVGVEHVQTVVSHDIIGRLMIQCARQHGLAAVWQKIMGFEGDEFYMREWPELVGRTYLEVLTMFEDAVPLGIRTPEGNHLLNPEDTFTIHEGDQIIVIAQDDDTYRPLNEPAATSQQGDTCPPGTSRRAPERILFCGWRRDMHDMIAVLDAFVYPGSELWLYNEVPVKEREKLLKKEGLDPTRLTNLTLVYKVQEVEGELVSRKRLEDLAPEQFSSILILADESATFSTADADQASADSDSRNLATLLLLRDLQSKRMGSEAALRKTESADGRIRPTVLRRQSTIKRDDRIMWYDSMQNAIKQTIIISEILDTRTRHLIQELEVSEFVLSNELVSMALAMVAENPEVNDILSELFTPDGNELYVHPASRYLRDGEVKSFFEVMVRAREKEEILVGLKLKGQKSPVLNPKGKAEQALSLKTVSSFVVILTGVDPDKPSRHASWVGEIPSTTTSSTGDVSSIEKGLNYLA
ncbi:g4408 [Coccomyxa viridis]|uniref:G4408 protein n=1 Tax=Coccomyxa viridis TaxID=1274662 RepID=A0ABP1FQ95_9CHLO